MYSEMKARVIEVSLENEYIQRLKIDKGSKRALLYKQMTKPVKVGDYVIVNTTATTLKLGTGGWDIVRHVLVEKDEVTIDQDRGHIMKARYTPIQHSVHTVESEESIHHEHFKEYFSLRGRPVLLAELHSMVPLIYYVSQEMKEKTRCVVIFDDQATLALSMSKQLSELHKENHFTSITVGQAFGGQFEAVTVASALQYATLVTKADLIIISVGPGVVGTGTMYGFSGLELAHWSHTVSALDGIPIWIPRLSFAETRERHYGLSHHTITPLAQFTFKRAILPFPFMEEEQLAHVKKQLAAQSFQTEHDIRFAKENNIQHDVERALEKAARPIETMGRGYEQDPIFFLAVAEAVRVTLKLKQDQ